MPSATLTHDDFGLTDESATPPSFSFVEDTTPVSDRSRRALLVHSHAQLVALAKRQGDTMNMQPYSLVLRLLGTLITDGSPTPQIGDNGEGGISVEWLVDGNSVRLDYEDETEILLSARTSTGDRPFCDAITAWWSKSDPTIVAARDFLRGLASSVRNPIALG